ncbi:gluconokinase [Labrenzia sp. PHM005]|uniref:gluconokinase n=1 Tax=Labrenzia sp. PHM005 TaxID=2590016 RepID=UPI001AD90E9C|nr:gluconokinase [Labrenzia sp. PHM005]
MQSFENRLLIVMGVCGVGKSALADHLSLALGAEMVEADDYHDAGSREKMAAGIPLTDEERKPWLVNVAKAAKQISDRGDSAIIACSSLKRSYRDILRTELGGCTFIHLTGERDQIAERLAGRTGHFVGEALLDSQIATLEPLETDEDGVTVDVSYPIARVADRALQELQLSKAAQDHRRNPAVKTL